MPETSVCPMEKYGHHSSLLLSLIDEELIEADSYPSEKLETDLNENQSSNAAI